MQRDGSASDGYDVDYANIDLGRIWTILQTDFPAWKESVERLAATIQPIRTLPPNVADFD